MQPLISPSKTAPPSLDRIVHRPRLVGLLQANADTPLTLILGQAAQGKSTLAAAYLRTLEAPRTWVNLSGEDSDPATLYLLLDQALQAALPQRDLTPFLSYPAASTGRGLSIPRYREWISGLYAALPSPLWIFMDGLDQIGADAPSLALLRVLVEELPPGVRLVMTSRVEPDIGMGNLKMRRKACILGSEALGFTLEETETFMKEICGVPCHGPELERIHGFCDGWVGGLILLAYRLRAVGQADRTRFIMEEIPDRFRRDVFDYFGEAVFNSEPESVQQFLCASSLFDLVDEEVMEACLGKEVVQEAMVQVVSRNLFVATVYDGDGRPCLRYHPLFRDFLSGLLKARFSPDRRRQCLISGAGVYEKRGELEKAVACCLAAGAFARAVPAIESCGMGLLQAARDSELERWLTMLPTKTLEGSPWLLLYLSMARRFVEAEQNIRRLIQAAALFAERGELGGRMLCMALLIESTIYLGRDAIPMATLLSEAESLLEEAGPERHPFEQAMLWLNVGFAHTLRGQRLGKGARASQTASLLAGRLGLTLVRIGALNSSLACQAIMGDLEAGEAACREIEAILADNPTQELRALYRINLVEFLTVKGDLIQARGIVEEGLALAERLGLFHFHAALQMHGLWVFPAIGEFGRAEAIGHQALEQAVSLGNLFHEGLISLFLGLSYYRKGDFDASQRLLERAKGVFSLKAMVAPGQLNGARFALGMALLHLHDPGRAAAELEAAFDFFASYESPLFETQLHLGMALLRHSQGRSPDAARHLRKGFGMAEAGGYEHMLFMSQKDAARACLLALELEVTEACHWAGRLLATRLAQEAGLELERLTKSPLKDLRNRALSIQYAIHRAQIPPLRILTLGGFQVLRGDSPILEGDWDRQQAKLLLKALVARGGRHVLRDVLVEDLWSENAMDKGERSFKVTLHRLRKSLEPRMERCFGSAYIHAEGNHVGLDTDLVTVDAERFETLIVGGRRAWKRGDLDQTMTDFEEALTLYQGDFLPQDLYADWAAGPRERLLKGYVQVLMDLGEIYEKEGRDSAAVGCWQRIADADPYDEEACRRLMRLYARRGESARALHVYNALEDRLCRELDATPDPKTAALCRRIRSTQKGPRDNP